MYDLILQLVLMVSLAVIVYMLASAVPRLEEKGSSGNPEDNKNTITASLDKLDARLNRLKDRLLRRAKVFVMRTDNLIQKELNKEEEKL